MELHYKLNGTGWADGSLVLEGKTAEFTVSYVKDALGELAGGIIDLITHFGQEIEVMDLETNETSIEPDNRAEVIWEGEPWGYRWNLELYEDLTIGIQFSPFADLDNEGTIAEAEGLAARIPFGDFVQAVTDMLRTVLTTHGLVGYRAAWIAHEFPIGHYLRLQQFLNEGGIQEMQLNANLDETPEDSEDEGSVEMLDTNLKAEIEMLRNIAGS